MHWGIRRTWILLNKYFLGHRIPYQMVSDFVKECPTCQKNRLEMTEGINPLIKHLKPEHHVD
jgi:hypothetical protein